MSYQHHQKSERSTHYYQNDGDNPKANRQDHMLFLLLVDGKLICSIPNYIIIAWIEGFIRNISNNFTFQIIDPQDYSTWFSNAKVHLYNWVKWIWEWCL